MKAAFVPQQLTEFDSLQQTLDGAASRQYAQYAAVTENCTAAQLSLACASLQYGHSTVQTNKHRLVGFTHLQASTLGQQGRNDLQIGRGPVLLQRYELLLTVVEGATCGSGFRPLTGLPETNTKASLQHSYTQRFVRTNYTPAVVDRRKRAK